jgi:UDP-N-acetylmuramoylalanine--D-glutamate ligase
MPQIKFTRKKIAVLGYGIEGQSAVKFLLKRKSRITVLDERKNPGQNPILADELKKAGIGYIYSPFPDLSGFDGIIVSPGIRPDIPVLQSARRSGIPVSTTTNIFMDSVPCRTIGITGTKGKGTTASLLYQMLRSDGRDAYLGGNIGTPPLDFLDNLTRDSIAVLELSSFQTFSMTRSPDIAVIIMTTSEHLDYHRDTEEYVAAKLNLVRHQTGDGQIIVNIDYDNSLKIGKLSGRDY